MITSIFINGEIPFVEGMKKLSDFEFKNWFADFPVLGSATPFAAYYFGAEATDITANNLNINSQATQYGTLDNSHGYIAVNTDNYLDTGYKAPAAITVGALIRRPPAAGSTVWFLADFAGSSAGVGFAVGVSTAGRLVAAGQNSGATAAALAQVDFPASIAVGDFVALTAYIRNGTVTIAVYDPSAQNFQASSAGLTGTRAAGTNDILIGRKIDNNTSTTSTDVVSVVLIDGELSTAEHLVVQQYLLNMA